MEDHLARLELERERRLEVTALSAILKGMGTPAKLVGELKKLDVFGFEWLEEQLPSFPFVIRTKHFQSKLRFSQFVASAKSTPIWPPFVELLESYAQVGLIFNIPDNGYWILHNDQDLAEHYLAGVVLCRSLVGYHRTGQQRGLNSIGLESLKTFTRFLGGHDQFLDQAANKLEDWEQSVRGTRFIDG